MTTTDTTAEKQFAENAKSSVSTAEKAREAAEAWRIPSNRDETGEIVAPKDDCVWGFEQGYLAALTASPAQGGNSTELIVKLREGARDNSIWSHERQQLMAQAADALCELTAAAPVAPSSGEWIEREAEQALRLARPIVEADLDAAVEHNDADWEGMSRTALEAIDAALELPSTPKPQELAGER